MYLFKCERSLKFNAGTGGFNQLPHTTGDGIHSLLQEVVWDVGDNVPNPVFQLFHCARFCPVHLLLCPAPQESVDKHFMHDKTSNVSINVNLWRVRIAIFCRGKAISIKHCDCVYVACKGHELYYIVICGLSGCTIFLYIIS